MPSLAHELDAARRTYWEDAGRSLAVAVDVHERARAAGDGPLRAYQLLVEAMEGQERAAIGRFVMRTKEYLVAIRVREGLLSLVTMRFHDEIRPITDLDLPGNKDQPKKAAVDEAVRLIEQLAADWDPKRYEDRHNECLDKIIKRKRKGQTIKAPAEPEQPVGSAPSAEIEPSAEVEPSAETERAVEVEDPAGAERPAEAERSSEAERSDEAERPTEAEQSAVERSAGAEQSAEAEPFAEAERLSEV